MAEDFKKQQLEIKEISTEIIKNKIANGHINILIGSGCSTKFISTLNDNNGNIEDNMNSEDPDISRNAKKQYYELIKKSLHIVGLTSNSDNEFKPTCKNYEEFIKFWYGKISQRELNIINKQINIFTTNFDMFLESTCEKLEIPYNDGFSGRINPIFSIDNFNKIQKFKSMQFDNTSDIPIFNIIKLHGSVSWDEKEKKIYFSKGEHIPLDLLDKDNDNFDKGYKQIAVINPKADKHYETVTHTTYASLLRRFTLELEKENSLLIIIGCSLTDKHIHNQLNAVLRSNPTLTVLFFSYEPYDKDSLNEKKYPNFYVIDKVKTFSSYSKENKENEENGKLSFSEIIDFLKTSVFKNKENKDNNEVKNNE